MVWSRFRLDWQTFNTNEPDFYFKKIQSHDNKQDKDTFKTFQVPIGNAKVAKSVVFQKDAPILSYCQKRWIAVVSVVSHHPLLVSNTFNMKMLYQYA